MATDTELEVLAQYSTPGLRKHELSREAKRDHLASAYKIKGERAEKILTELYPNEAPNG